MHTIPVRPFVVLKLATLAALACLLLLLSGCRWVGVKGNGHLRTEERPVANFTKIEADGAFEVNWAPGAPSLSIRTDENLLEYIRTHVNGDKLYIDWVKPLKGTRGIKISVASASLIGAQLNGAVRFNGSRMSGADFYLEANGATRIALDGAVTGLSATMNGASRLDADTLTTRVCELSIAGAGRAEVNASEILKVAISGAGKVRYTGNPRVEKEISGAGSVRRRD